jgi:hypothetical protein
MKSFVKIVCLLLVALSAHAQAGPFVISDPLSIGVTQCGVLLDAAPKIFIPVTALPAPATGNICKFDLGIPLTVGGGPLVPGSHTIAMTAITVNDPIWGSQESVPSLPITFPTPGVAGSPSGLRLTP